MQRLTLIAMLLVLSGGCAGRYYWHSHTHYDYAAYPTAPAQVVVSQPPPAVPVAQELRPPQPSSTSTWVEGHWSYNGMWTWVDGTWVNGYAGWVWTPPVIVIVDGYYVLHRGYFRQPAYQPAPAYTHPNRIYISVRTDVGHHHHHDRPGANPPPAPEQPPLDRPRELAVPGAVVRTPPAPPAPTPAPAPVAQPQPERPVLVAPGATVSRRPSHARPDPDPAPAQPATPAQPTPPVLSNVPPVIERPTTEPGKNPGHNTVPTPTSPTPPAPVAEAPQVPRPDKHPGHDTAPTPAPIAATPKPVPVAPPVQEVPTPSAPPTQVTPGGHASMPSRRSRPTPSAPEQNQAQQSRNDRNDNRGTQDVAPVRNDRETRSTQDNRSRNATFDAMRTQLNQNRDANSAQSREPARDRNGAPASAPSAPRSVSNQERSKPARSTVVRPSDSASRPAGRSRKDPDAKPTDKPAFTCTLVTTEAPRGGQLDVHGDNFGATPVLRIGGKVTRILRRNTTDIRVQIPTDSNGGSVTVQSNGTTVECGTLTIIGTNR